MSNTQQSLKNDDLLKSTSETVLYYFSTKDAKYNEVLWSFYGSLGLRNMNVRKEEFAEMLVFNSEKEAVRYFNNNIKDTEFNKKHHIHIFKVQTITIKEREIIDLYTPEQFSVIQLQALQDEFEELYFNLHRINCKDERTLNGTYQDEKYQNAFDAFKLIKKSEGN